MSLVLPPELARNVEALVSRFDSGLVTFEEFRNGLIQAVQRFAGDEYDRAHPDWAKDALFDRAAWETAYETKRQAEVKVGAAYALTVATAYPSTGFLVEWVLGSSQWRQAIETAGVLLSEAARAGLESLAPVSTLAWAASWHGALPPVARERVRGVALGSAMSMVDLVESDREGDAARVAEIITESSTRGCVSPASRVLRLRRAEGRPIAAAELSAVLDPKELAARGEFGGLTHIAVELLADGADKQALAWSSTVDDSQLFHPPTGGSTSSSDRPPYRAHEPEHQERDHEPAWCVPLCNAGDARLLGALAVIDWLAGDKDRAHARALACDRGADPQGWSASGAMLLAHWVLSRQLGSTEGAEALTDMINQADSSHVHLGLLGVQIHAELADLATAAGDQATAAHHRTRADWYRARPEMHLHFEPFQFPSLLVRLPLAN